MTSRSIIALAIPFASFLSCADPVLSDKVDTLGNETSGVDKGQFHRAGQPCVTCHQEGGPASDSPFTVAGTVFAQPMRQIGVEGAEIRMTDADGTKHTAKTNCVGNFFVKADEWQPKFPILVEVAKGNNRRSMRSAIGREASCATCHILGLRDFGSPGQIRLYDTESEVDTAKPPIPAQCPNDQPQLTQCPEDRL